MIKHKKIYCDFFGYTEADFIPCECCNMGVITDVHHLSKRGMGGSKHKDIIYNLVGVTRGCHVIMDNNYELNEKLRIKHKNLVDSFATTHPKQLETFLKKYPNERKNFEWLKLQE